MDTGQYCLLLVAKFHMNRCSCTVHTFLQVWTNRYSTWQYGTWPRRGDVHLSSKDTERCRRVSPTARVPDVVQRTNHFRSARVIVQPEVDVDGVAPRQNADQRSIGGHFQIGNDLHSPYYAAHSHCANQTIRGQTNSWSINSKTST